MVVQMVVKFVITGTIIGIKFVKKWVFYQALVMKLKINMFHHTYFGVPVMIQPTGIGAIGGMVVSYFHFCFVILHFSSGP